MLYTILVEYYIWFGLGLIAVTWFTRKGTPNTRTNLIYGYGMVVVLGFLLGLDWVAGIIFGLLVLEIGKVFKVWLDKKESQLNKRS